ncbi:MAG TPA: bifunctional 4-hydroxy-2-oxoglutarate aldolase/2-dehydro-3-deoxy-phosphogluconate aldolase [Gemmatimonadaceae bacterium]|nr:bifunctional 4-hydroxy-2-oxoglutarate aldolase/2-dehydro-3-deoxy-phosphogluconate aldolase [Gemmatimonadaceae bacterium]
MNDILTRLKDWRVLPVIVLDDARHAVPLARALRDGGLPCAEVTFRTACAEDAIRAIASEVPDVAVGAGTVLTTRQAERAREAGARFIVAPGYNPTVVDYCIECGLPVIPGVCTPSEIEHAMERGIEVMKFFPAEAMGGVRFLKAIAAPYAMARFVPTGGITPANLPEYLAIPQVVACGGSWLAPRDWIAAERFDRIREETETAVRAAGTHTGGK